MADFAQFPGKSFLICSFNLVVHNRNKITFCLMYLQLLSSSSDGDGDEISRLGENPGAYAGGGGALGVRAPSPPTWEKSSAQKCPKEERKFRPDMLAKKNVHVPLRYHKIKTKKLGKKKKIVKGKG